MAFSGAMTNGTVKVWLDERGMGFITPEAGGEDVFVHRSDLLDGDWLQAGSMVMFQEEYDLAKGKRIAKQVSGAQAKGAGKGAAPGAQMQMGQMGMAAVPTGAGQFLNGVVKAWYEDRGMGFLAPDSGGEDVFVHRSALLDGNCLQVGAPVVFEDGVDPLKGKRCAANVQGATNAPGGGKGKGKGGAAASAPSQMWGPGGLTAPAAMGARKTATVKSWLEQRGMGFITPSSGGEDLFVHRTFLLDAQALIPGTMVTYEEGWDAGKGKPVAQNVSADAAGAGWGSSAPAAASAGTSTGTVKAWIEGRGMGFITPDDGDADMFVHRSDLVSGQWLDIGARVWFEKAWDSGKGKAIAKRVSTSAGGGAGGFGPSAQTGTVKMWFDDKAFGFIVPDDGGADVMVHKNEIAGGGQLWQGQRVRFEAGWDAAKGKLKATRCAPEDQGGGAWQGGGDGTGHPDNLFIGGLPLDITEQKLSEVFTAYGQVASCKILPPNGRPDCAAFVRFQDSKMAAWLVENMNGNIPIGLSTPLSVRFAQSGKGGSYGKAASKGAGGRSSPYGEPAGMGSAAGAGGFAMAGGADLGLDAAATAAMMEMMQA